MMVVRRGWPVARWATDRAMEIATRRVAAARAISGNAFVLAHGVARNHNPPPRHLRNDVLHLRVINTQHNIRGATNTHIFRPNVGTIVVAVMCVGVAHRAHQQ